MANDMFLKLDGITGESQDAVHAGAIDVLFWKWSIVQHAGAHAGSNGDSGKADVNALTIDHYTDRASPSLMRYCLTGKPISNATLIVRKAGGKALDYLKIRMEDVMVSSVSMASINNMRCGREKVSLSFGRVTKEYVVQNEKGGSSGSVIRGYDIKRNCEI